MNTTSTYVGGAMLPAQHSDRGLIMVGRSVLDGCVMLVEDPILDDIAESGKNNQ